MHIIHYARNTVGCNSVVKFGAMRDYAMDRLHADWIATGHYARLWHRDRDNVDANGSIAMPKYVEQVTADAPERDWIATWGMGGGESTAAPSLLLAGADRTKDQSYFLCGVNGHAFRNVLFPLGDLRKATTDDTMDGGDALSANNNKSVRDIAIEAGLPTATKRESMGICFIGKRNFHSFISQYLPSVPRPGNFVDVDTGEVSLCKCVCMSAWYAAALVGDSLIFLNHLQQSNLFYYVCLWDVDCWEAQGCISLHHRPGGKDIGSLAKVVHCWTGRRRTRRR